MDTQATYAAIDEARKILYASRKQVLIGGVAWVKLWNAEKQLHSQQDALFADPCANCTGCVDCVPEMSDPNDNTDQRSY